MKNLVMSKRSFLFLYFLSIAVFTGCAGYGWPNNTRPHTYMIAVGDLDGDGDLDLYLANGENEGVAPNTIWLNDGSGNFHQSINQTDDSETHFVALGDLDGDGHLDAIIGANGAGRAVINDGNANMAYSNRYLDSELLGVYMPYPALGDLDGDGDPDLLLAGCCGGATSGAPGGDRVMFSSNTIWFNDGSGGFTNSGQLLGRDGTVMAALGDLDGDGNLDIFEANSSSMTDTQGGMDRNQPNKVWLNDGSGFFADSGQRLGREESYAVALGDLDGDGSLDAFVGNRNGSKVWLNDGSGVFRDSDQVLGNRDMRLVVLGDLDGDEDLDAYCFGRGFGEIWINQGGAQGGLPGSFEFSESLSFSLWHASTLGDVDGDGDLDIIVALLDREVIVWLNDGAASFTQQDK